MNLTNIEAAEILRNGFGLGFSPDEFGEYVFDYYNNPSSYNIDTDSSYYLALEIAYNQIADIFRIPIWQKINVENSEIYKLYKN